MKLSIQNDAEVLNNKAKNRKIITMYRILSYDLIFYYTISYLFLVNVKGLSTAQIVFADSFYPLFKLIFQLPCTIFIQKFGKRNSLIVSNIAVAIFVLLTIGLIDTFTMIISNLFLAFAFVIKAMAESTLLYDSLEDTSNKREQFTKYEGKSAAGYFFLDAITSLGTGFLYVINPYIPLIICLIVTLFTIFLSAMLHEIPTDNEDVAKQSAKEQFIKHFKDLGIAFKFILRSRRLRALILYNSLMASLMFLTNTFRRSLLDDVGVSSEYFGIIFTIFGIVASISATKSYSIHKTYTNKTLTLIGLSYTLSIIVYGAVVLLKLPLFIMYYLLLLAFAVNYIMKGPFYTLIKQYLNSFCDSNMRLKIYSANLFIEYISSTVLSLICSWIMGYYSNAMTTLILGLVSTTAMIILLIYMSSRADLKPEEYPKEDIYYDEKQVEN